MQMTDEFKYCKNLFTILGRKEVYELLESSNLSDREYTLVELRFIKGLSLKECSSILMIEENSVSKALQKAINKLYTWILLREKAFQISEMLDIKCCKINNLSITNP